MSLGILFSVECRRQHFTSRHFDGTLSRDDYFDPVLPDGGAVVDSAAAAAGVWRAVQP